MTFLDKIILFLFIGLFSFLSPVDGNTYPSFPFQNELLMTGAYPEVIEEFSSHSTLGWQLGSPIPEENGYPDRWADCGSGVSRGLLWLFGGRTDADWKFLARVGTYDPFEGLWSLDYPALGTGRAYLAGAANEAAIYALGGTDESNVYIENAFEGLDVSGGNNWISMAHLPEERSDGAAVIYGDSLYYIGGTKSIWTPDAASPVIAETNLWRYNMVSGKWITNLKPSPIGLVYISAAVVKGKIYIPGNDLGSKTYIYDIASDTWLPEIAAPESMLPSIYYQCIAVGDQIWRIGGLVMEGGFAVTNEVWVLDTVTGLWSKNPSSMNIPRMSFAAGIVGTRVVVAGGIKEIVVQEDTHVDFISTNTTEFLELADADSDGIPDLVEQAGCTDPNDADSDDDGIPDGVEDANRNGTVDQGETDPCDRDSDGDGIKDGTELGYSLAMVGSDTDLIKFQPDLDPATKTDPLKSDTDGDGLTDGQEDFNKDGRVDYGEFDPNAWSVYYVEQGATCGGREHCFSDIPSAITEAVTHVLIKVREGQFNKPVTVAAGKQITLSGGYNSAFSANPGETVIPMLTCEGGLAGLDKITIGTLSK
ncbi:hypothetical protein GW860_01770 [bacterium]|nr:hypothetical protein [bacterium]